MAILYQILVCQLHLLFMSTSNFEPGIISGVPTTPSQASMSSVSTTQRRPWCFTITFPWPAWVGSVPHTLQIPLWAIYSTTEETVCPP